MSALLRVSRHVIVVAVLGCVLMFGAVTVFAGVAVVQAISQMVRGGPALSEVATVTVHAFKILDLFLLGAILYIVALGLGALFLGASHALPPWLEVRELHDLKVVLSQSVIVVMLIAFLGDVLEWEAGADILSVGAGIALVIAATAFMLREPPPGDSNGAGGRRGP